MGPDDGLPRPRPWQEKRGGSPSARVCTAGPTRFPEAVLTITMVLFPSSRGRAGLSRGAKTGQALRLCSGLVPNEDAKTAACRLFPTARLIQGGADSPDPWVGDVGDRRGVTSNLIGIAGWRAGRFPKPDRTIEARDDKRDASRTGPRSRMLLYLIALRHPAP